MFIRVATEDDLEDIAVLFYETINAVSAKDYNEEQLKLWSTRDMKFWKRRFSEQYFLVAILNNRIVGFTSLTESGYLDFMYVHKDHQRIGVAKMLLDAIEKHAAHLNLPEIHSHVSVTARPFFEKQGFVLIREQRKKLSGNDFTNYAMRKFLK